MKHISKGFIRTSFSLAALFAGASAASAQTSGTLTALTTAYNYSTAPWVITSGPGAYPDGGGTATFNPILGATPGTLAGVSTVTFDVTPTLSSLIFNTPIQYVLATGAGQFINASAGGLTLNTQSTAQNVSINGLSISVALGSQITGSISGGGSAGLTRTGAGNFYLAPTAANTYTGGTHFNGGFTTVAGTAAIGDSVFGATGAGNGLSFNGGSLLFATTGGLTTARDIFIDAGGANIVTNTATTLGGIISGAGTLTQSALSASMLTLTGANTFTGATVLRGPNSNSSGAAAMALSGNGSLAASSSYSLLGTFTLDNTGVNLANRLSDTAPVTLRGANFISNGFASAASSETIGAVTITNGFNNLLVTPGAGQANRLTIPSLTRQNNATLNFRGANLGGAPGADTSNIYVNAAPTLVGGGGGAGSTGISIIPFAVGNSTSSVALTAAGQISSSFVTNDVNGIRPLAPAEFATAFGVNNTDNVRITAVTAAPAATVNALLVAPAVASTAAAPVLTGGTVNVTSGALLYSPTANVTGFIGANVNFGAAEGIVANTSLLTLSGVISGSNGLTLSTTYAPTNNYTPTLSLTGANTYTGNTIINSGAIAFSGTVGGAPGAFSPSGSVILNGGTILASLVPTAVTTFNSPINVIGNGLNYISPSASGFTSTFNGNISVAGNLNIEGFTNAALSGLNFNGIISGAGSLTDVGFSYVVLNGNNTYSGGTFLAGSSGSTFLAGTDTAFGSGPITFNVATATLSGVGTAARTFANPLFLNNTPTFGGAAPLTFTGAVNLNGSRSISASNTALTALNGVVSNGSLVKLGVGAVAFNSPTGNTFTGGFSNPGAAANSSAIYANNTSGSAFGPGAVIVGGVSATVYSTLAGNFTTSGATNLGGRLSPGNGAGLTPATAGQGSIGTANFGNALTLTSTAASSLYLEISSSTSRDTVNVAGSLTLAGTVYFATTDGYVVQLGNTFDFVDATTTTVNGTLTFNSTGVTFAPGVGFDTSAFATNGTVTAIAVPEPGTVSLLGAACAMVGAAVLRRRRR